MEENTPIPVTDDGDTAEEITPLTPEQQAAMESDPGAYTGIEEEEAQ